MHGFDMRTHFSIREITSLLTYFYCTSCRILSMLVCSHIQSSVTSHQSSPFTLCGVSDINYVSLYRGCGGDLGEVQSLVRAERRWCVQRRCLHACNFTFMGWCLHTSWTSPEPSLATVIRKEIGSNPSLEAVIAKWRPTPGWYLKVNHNCSYHILPNSSHILR
jgi:hypothetical protein